MIGVRNRRLLCTHLAALLVFVVCGSILTVTQTVSAQLGFIEPTGSGSLYALLLKILNAVVFILFPIVILMLVYTGFLFVAAQGNESKITQARTALMWTVVGALVLLGSKALAMAVCNTVKDLGANVVCN